MTHIAIHGPQPARVAAALTERNDCQTCGRGEARHVAYVTDGTPRGQVVDVCGDCHTLYLTACRMARGVAS